MILVHCYLVFALLLQIAQATPVPVPEPVNVQQIPNFYSALLAFIGIIPATIAAIIAGMALLQSRANATVAANVEKKTDAVVEKTNEIHVLANGNLSKMSGQLEAANVKIEGFLNSQVDSARKIADLESLIKSLVKSGGNKPLNNAEKTVIESGVDVTVIDGKDGKTSEEKTDKALEDERDAR